MAELNHQEAGAALCAAVRFLHQRGWCYGTGGNFSVRTEESPLQFLVSPSGADKGELTPEMLVLCDERGDKLRGTGRPSAETLLHAVIYRERNAGSVLHTHSVWNTILSAKTGVGQLRLTGYEMLKGLSGVTTHEHQEIVPVLANSQDMTALASEATAALCREPSCHGFLLAGHGLYTWGRDVTEARRHIEIFEFLLEVEGLTSLRPPSLNRL